MASFIRHFVTCSLLPPATARFSNFYVPWSNDKTRQLYVRHTQPLVTSPSCPILAIFTMRRRRACFLSVGLPIPFQSLRCTRAFPQSSARSPRKSVRVRRKYTHRSAGWEWRGAAPRSRHTNFFRRFSLDEGGALLRSLELLWEKSLHGVTESRIVAKMTRFGVTFLKNVSLALQRTLYPDVENELVVEYGIAQPDPNDRTYVDPLKDWQPSMVTYYRDSFWEESVFKGKWRQWGCCCVGV